MFSEYFLVNMWRLDLEDKADMGRSLRGCSAIQGGLLVVWTKVGATETVGGGNVC